MTSARTRDRLVQRLREQGIANMAVLDRIRNVPRHIFVDEALASRAYEDTALPIGFGQTISQPYIVARMTEALLEGGAAAARCWKSARAAATRRRCWRRWSARIYSIERIEGLQKRARARLKELGIAQRALQARRRLRRLEVAGAVRRHHGRRGAARRAGGVAQRSSRSAAG